MLGACLLVYPMIFSGAFYLDIGVTFLLAAISALGSGTRALAVWEQRWARVAGPTCVYLHGIADPGNVGAIVAPLHDAATAAALNCERAFLLALDGSCRTPIAGYARIEGDRLYFSGMILSPDGSEAHSVAREGATRDAAAIGAAAGEAVRARAGARFFDGWS